MRLNIRATILALGVTMLVTPAAVTEGHVRDSAKPVPVVAVDR